MRKNRNSDDEKTVVPSEKHYADFEPAAVPAAPDGGVPMGFATEPPAAPPKAIPENFICLRGPCRYYWHLVTMSGEGNPEGTWEALGLSEPRQHHHTCLVQPGMETDLTDDCAYECSKWDPLAPAELIQLSSRRRAYEASVQDEELEEGDEEDGSDEATQG